MERYLNDLESNAEEQEEEEENEGEGYEEEELRSFESTSDSDYLKTQTQIITIIPTQSHPGPSRDLFGEREEADDEEKKVE
jgi:hypothetical protein